MKNKFFAILFAVVMISILTACGEKNLCKNGHEWENATCTEPKMCKICGLTSGEALGHSFDEPIITEESSCSEAGSKRSICSVCGKVKDEPIPTKAHTPGKWEIISPATATEKGKKIQKCLVCGGTVNEEEFEKPASEIKADYKIKCSDYTYEEIARHPDNYKGKYAHFIGQIIQSVESEDSYKFRVNISKDIFDYGWTGTIYVTYTKKEASEIRLLEDDIVDLYGELGGTYTYETVMGNKMTIPLLHAEYVELTY